MSSKEQTDKRRPHVAVTTGYGWKARRFDCQGNDVTELTKPIIPIAILLRCLAQYEISGLKENKSIKRQTELAKYRDIGISLPLELQD